MGQMSAAEYREVTKAGKPSKYGNKKVRIGGYVFDSKKEANRYLHLKARLDAGEISHLEIQPVFKLCGRDGQPLRYDSGRQPKYIADFSYFDGQKRVVEDVKSPATRTPQYKLKKAIVQSMYPAVRIVEV